MKDKIRTLRRAADEIGRSGRINEAAAAAMRCLLDEWEKASADNNLDFTDMTRDVMNVQRTIGHFLNALNDAPQAEAHMRHALGLNPITSGK